MAEPVLIVGAGPVGLSLALALARRGIACEVFEAAPELSAEARASTFHPRTLEMLAEWGVADALLARGYRVRRLQYWERATRRLVAQFDYGAIAGDTPYPFRLQCPQSVYTRLILPVLAASPLVRVRMGHRLTALRGRGDGVEAVLETSDGIARVRGSFLCGADGARSTVRKELGLGFAGKTYEDRFLLVASTIDLAPLFHDFGPVAYLFDPDEWVIVLQLPDVTRVVFRLKEGEDEEEARGEASVRARLARFLDASGGNGHRAANEAVPAYELRGTSIYKVHQRVADRFLAGQACILGDAAHINNPMGGMGMNSGIHDAYHLAPAIELALRHGDRSGLLAWAAARESFAREDVQVTSDRNYRDMAAAQTADRDARNAGLSAIAADPALARAHLLRASMLGER